MDGKSPHILKPGSLGRRILATVEVCLTLAAYPVALDV
jgi:hypothetical protein